MHCFYIVGLKDHVNLGFAVKGLTKEQQDLFEGKGKLMRHLKFYKSSDIKEGEIVKALKLVKKNAQALDTDTSKSPKADFYDSNHRSQNLALLIFTLLAFLV